MEVQEIHYLMLPCYSWVVFNLLVVKVKEALVMVILITDSQVPSSGGSMGGPSLMPVMASGIRGVLEDSTSYLNLLWFHNLSLSLSKGGEREGNTA